MSAPTCTLCNRPAAWRLGDELMCEMHKEKTIERFGVDRFPIERLAESDDKFLIRGRHKHGARVKVPTRKKALHPKT